MSSFTDNPIPELLDEHGSAVQGMLRKLCRDPATAEDLFQDSVVKVLKNQSSIDGIKNPKSWLMTIAYRTFLDWRKSKRSLSLTVETSDTAETDPSFRMQSAERNNRVREAIESLSENLQEVLVLHYSGELTLRETAEVMQTNLGTVKSRLNRAIGELRKKLR